MNENDANLISSNLLYETNNQEEEEPKTHENTYRNPALFIEKVFAFPKILLICGIVFLSAFLNGTFIIYGVTTL